MPSRVRSRTLEYSEGGTILYEGKPFSAQTSTASYTERMEDVTGKKPYKDNPLLLEKKSITSPRLNGTNALGFKFQDIRVCTLNNVPGTSLVTHDNSTIVNRTLSQSGPLTPRVYLPLFVYEMKDIPDMLRHAGNLLHGIRTPSRLSPDKEAASATLAYQFGWAPLMQDIGRMIDFGSAVKRRQRDLAKANSTRGLRRKITIMEDSKALKGTDALWSTNGTFFTSVPFTGTESIRHWTTIRWTIRDLKQIGTVPSWDDAFKTEYGLNKGHIPIEVWKALPWSWCADWFLDVSNILTANYNSIYYKPSSINSMTTRKVTKTWSAQRVTYNGGKQTVTLSSGEASLERKFRTQYPPVTSFRMKLPFLDNFKLSILGSMTILRIRGR